MRYTPRTEDPVFDAIEPVVTGLGMVLVELVVSRHKGSTQIRVVVYKKGIVGIDDCSRVHHAILPRLELAFPEEDLSIEVSSPGIDRLIKDAAEFSVWLGRGLKCFRSDTSEWVGGILRRADATGLRLEGKDGPVDLDFTLIAKAKLDHSIE
jgi:ribosome maturation factor RimP